MAVTATLRNPGVGNVGKWLEAEYDIVFTGSYPAGGDTVDFRGKGLPGNAIPTVRVIGSSGYFFLYAKGTNLGDGKILVRQPTTASGSNQFNEHLTAAYNASVTGDTNIIAIVRVAKGKA
jgi:hypothetical protein